MPAGLTHQPSNVSSSLLKESLKMAQNPSDTHALSANQSTSLTQITVVLQLMTSQLILWKSPNLKLYSSQNPV